MSSKAGPPSAAMEPLLQPSAPPADHPAGPPSYNEAMGWAPPLPHAPDAAMQMPMPAQRQMVNVVANPMAGQPIQNVPLQHQAAPANIIVQRAPAPSVVLIGPKACKLECPSCHASIKTTTTITNKWTAHLTCIILFAVGCCLCCWVPYCMGSCKQVAHTCPNCKAYLGKYDG